jgi:hypothetical protein
MSVLSSKLRNGQEALMHVIRRLDVHWIYPAPLMSLFFWCITAMDTLTGQLIAETHTIASGSAV